MAGRRTRVAPRAHPTQRFLGRPDPGSSWRPSRVGVIALTRGDIGLGLSTINDGRSMVAASGRGEHIVKSVLILIASVSVVALAAAPAAAQQQSQSGEPQSASLDEIVITARKREEQISDVPASISVFSGQQLEDLGGIADMRDLSYLAPGLAFVDTGNINAELNIRGAGAGTARVAGVDAPFGLLRNGVSVAGGNLGGRIYTRADLFDVQRIEIVRGPQGALYGVNAVGGIINLVNNRPSFVPHARAGVSWSDEVERGSAEAILNIPASSQLAFRIGGQLIDADGGQFRNVVSGRYGDRERFEGGRLSALWQPTNDFSVLAFMDGATERTASNRIRVTFERNDPSAAPGPADPDGPFLYGQNSPDRVDRDLLNGTVEIRWGIAAGQLTSISSYRERDTRWTQDEDGTAPGYAQLPWPGPSCFTRSCVTNVVDDTTIRSQELRLDGQLGANLKWLAGANWQKRTTDFAVISDGRTLNNAPAPSPVLNNGSVTLEEDTQYGVFGSLSWSVSDAWTLDLAARWSQSDKSGEAYVVRRGPGPTLCPYLDPIRGDLGVLPTCVASPISFEETFENTSPTLALTYAVSSDWNLFATVGRGHRSGGFNGTAALFPGVVPEVYDSEEADAYEIGTKFSLGGGLVTATLYRNEYSNLLISLPVPGDLGRSFRANAGRAQTQGADLEWVGRASFVPERFGSLDFTFAVNWLAGEIESGPYQGREVEGSPEQTYTATAVYGRKLIGAWRLLASVAYRGQRGGFTNTTQINNLVRLEDLDLWDARLALNRGPFTVSVAAENLFDEEYVSLRDPTRSVYGDPRQVTFRFDFRPGTDASGPR